MNLRIVVSAHCFQSIFIETSHTAGVPSDMFRRMSKPDQKPGHYQHRREQRKTDAILTTVQALFGGSVVYRLFAHFLKHPEFEAHVAKLIPKDKLPLIAAGTVAAGAIGLISQRHLSASAEKQLGHALDEMTEEARDLREENERLRTGQNESSEPRPRISQVRHHATIAHKSTDRTK